MKEVLPWMVRWACRADKRDFCSALAALVSPVQNILFLIVHYFNAFFPIAQRARQAAVLARLSLSMCLWFSHPVPAPIREPHLTFEPTFPKLANAPSPM
jgi:hypothetical protein